MTAFQAALAEGFCPECVVPLQNVKGSNMPYCPQCRGWWSGPSISAGDESPDSGEGEGDTAECRYCGATRPVADMIEVGREFWCDDTGCRDAADSARDDEMFGPQDADLDEEER